MRTFRLASILLLAPSPLMAVPPQAPPIVVAHRGSSYEAPENTLPAFELAWQQGADAIEGDFHLTGDRQIVCIHDDTTQKFRGEPLTVRKTRLAKLKALDAGSWKGKDFVGTRVPTLAEVMATVPAGKQLYIEIKSSPRIIKPLIRQIEASELAPEQITFICFSQRVVKTLKRQRPDWRVCWLTDLRQQAKKGLSPSPAEIIATLKRLQADGVSVMAHPSLDQEFVETIRQRGFEFHVWTVDDPDFAQQLASWGTQSITTNQPAEVGAALR